jgi:hypothetical protein
MDIILVVLLFLSGTFTFAFGLAWTLPLVTAGIEERKIEDQPRFRGIADILLILNDMIPIFFIFDILRQAPEDYSAAKKQWKSEGMIRASFYISLLSGISTVCIVYILF